MRNFEKYFGQRLLKCRWRNANCYFQPKRNRQFKWLTCLHIPYVHRTSWNNSLTSYPTGVVIWDHILIICAVNIDGSTKSLYHAFGIICWKSSDSSGSNPYTVVRAFGSDICLPHLLAGWVPVESIWSSFSHVCVDCHKNASFAEAELWFHQDKLCSLDVSLLFWYGVFLF